MGKSCENAKTVALHRNKVLSGRENISNILILMSNIFLEESSQDNQQCGLGVGNCPLEYNKIMIKSICDFFGNVTNLCWFMFASSFAMSSRVRVKPGA
jgi:hypothetical protein